jgi:hypothetical protein
MDNRSVYEDAGEINISVSVDHDKKSLKIIYGIPVEIDDRLSYVRITLINKLLRERIRNEKPVVLAQQFWYYIKQIMLFFVSDKVDEAPVAIGGDGFFKIRK